MYQKEIFANYELDDSRWKRILLIMLGGSLALHLSILLTALFVPAVRDALHIASIFSDASERVYIDKDYLQTDIEDATIIDLAPSNFEYPAGYFQLANGDAPAPDYVAMTTPPQPDIVGYDSSLTTNNDFPPINFEQSFPSPTPFPIPTPNFNVPSIVNTPLPSSTSSLPKLPKTKRNAKLKELTAVNSTETAEAAFTPESSNTEKVAPTPKPAPVKSPETAAKNPAAGFEINKKPLEDFGKIIKGRVNVDKNINLNADFAVSLAGEFDKTGKIQKLAIVNKSGDEEMIKVATQMLAAVNESGWLNLLEELYKDGNGKVLFSISQSKDKVLFVIQSDRQNPEKANTLSSTLNFSLGLGKNFVKGPDELVILNNTKVETNGKQVIINLDMPRAVAQEMINRKLTEVKPEAPATQPSSSTAQTGK